MKNRVCIFIDGSNFYFALKQNNFPTRVDYYELSKALAGPDRELVRTYYYNSAYDSISAADQAKTQQSFFDSLRKTPFLDVRLGKLVPVQDGSFRPKGEKALFAAELVYYAAHRLFDTAIVVTDDTDFSPVLASVKELGRTVEIALFKTPQPRELVQASDTILPISEVLEKFSSKIFPTVPDPEPGPEDNVGNRVLVKDASTVQTKTKPSKPKNFFDQFRKTV